MRRFLALCLCSCSLLFSSEPPKAELKPRLAILPLKEEGKNTLGDVSDTLNTLVANAFLETRNFQLVERHQIQTLLTESKFQRSALVDEATAAELGKHLGVKYVLVGSYLAEKASSYNLSVTLSLRLVDVGNAMIYKSFLETAEGSTLGATLPKLSKGLADKIADLQPGEVMDGKPHRIKTMVIAMYAGDITCAKKAQTHTESVSLSFFDEKFEDYTFLATEVGKLFPADVKLLYETESIGQIYPPGLVEKLHPDGVVMITFDRTGKIHTFSQESEHRAEVHVKFINGRDLNVIGVKNFSTSLIKGKLYEVFPAIKEELTRRLQKELPPLPFEQ